MSKADAKKFIKLLHTDEDFRKAVHDAHKNIVQVAKKKKLNVTREELTSALKQHWLANDGKDDDDKACFIPLSEAPGF